MEGSEVNLAWVVIEQWVVGEDTIGGDKEAMLVELLR